MVVTQRWSWWLTHYWLHSYTPGGSMSLLSVFYLFLVYLTILLAARSI
jgi:hypothetical protein